MRVPRSGEQHLRLTGRHGDVGDANVRSLIEHAQPVVSAVGGLVDAALVIGAVGVPERTDIDGACVGRVNQDAADLPGIIKADVLPCSSAIVASVHAIARCQIGPDIGLARAHVDHLGIRRSNSERTDGSDGLLVEDRLPDGAGIGGLPHAAIDAAEEKVLVAAGHTADGDHAACTKRADQSPAQTIEQLGRKLLRACRHECGHAKEGYVDRQKLRTPGREAKE